MDRVSKGIDALAEMGEDIQITISRCDADGVKNHKEASYSVKYKKGITLQNALQQIYQNEDASIAFRPFTCNKGICMSCLVTVNGETEQACTRLDKTRRAFMPRGRKNSSGSKRSCNNLF